MSKRETGEPGSINCPTCKASVVMAYDENKAGRPIVYYDVDNGVVNSMGKPHAHQPKPKDA